MTEHDPLCGSGCCTPDTCTHNCRCDLIAEVRADERGKFVATDRFLTKEGEASIPKHIVEFIRADEREKAAFSLRVAAKMMMVNGLPINAETAKVLHRCATSIYFGRGES